jgi:peptidyl-prolyl cis-trans isomerase B (cyclophilin B)
MKGKIFYYIFLLLGVAFIIWVIVLNSGEDALNYSIREQNGTKIYSIEDVSLTESEKQTDLVLIMVRDYGAILAELYPDVAPITVKNFKKLVSSKFYDGLIFHRVISNFMIQTGDPSGTGTGGSDEKIKGEFINNGVENSISHKRGVLSMARVVFENETSESLNSASSQFFIVQSDSTYLDGNYAAFGKVLNGFDVIDDISKVRTNENDKPLTDVVIDCIIFVNYFEGEN